MTPLHKTCKKNFVPFEGTVCWVWDMIALSVYGSHTWVTAYYSVYASLSLIKYNIIIIIIQLSLDIRCFD